MRASLILGKMIGRTVIMVIMLSSTPCLAEDKITSYTDENGQAIYTNEKQVSAPSDMPPKTHTLQPIRNASEFNPSFEDLKPVIELRIQQEKDSIDYQKYLIPLHRDMTASEVKNVWGDRISGGMHEHSNPRSNREEDISILHYPIGVSLYFDHNRLRGWKIEAWQNDSGGKVNDSTAAEPGEPLVQTNPSISNAVPNKNTESAVAGFTAAMGLIVLIGISFFVLWLIALRDILRNEFIGSNKGRKTK
jgi:hypothetical protein